MLSQLTEKTYYIYYEIVDSKGNVVPTANNLVQFIVVAWIVRLSVDNGEQASLNVTKNKQTVHGFAKFLTVRVLWLSNQLSKQVNSPLWLVHSDFLKIWSTTIFTGKKDQEENCFSKQRCLARIHRSSSEMPSKVQDLSTDDGSCAKTSSRMVSSWVNQPGIFNVSVWHGSAM